MHLRHPVWAVWHVLRSSHTRKSPIISGSFAKRDLQLKASYGSWPPCMGQRDMYCDPAIRKARYFQLLCDMTHSTRCVINGWVVSHVNEAVWHGWVMSHMNEGVWHVVFCDPAISNAVMLLLHCRIAWRAKETYKRDLQKRPTKRPTKQSQVFHCILELYFLRRNFLNI